MVINVDFGSFTDVSRLLGSSELNHRTLVPSKVGRGRHVRTVVQSFGWSQDPEGIRGQEPRDSGNERNK